MIRRRVLVWFTSFVCLLAAARGARANLAGVDAGLSARELIRTTDSAVLRAWGGSRPWIRIRGLPDPTNPKHADAVEPEREALRELRRLGFKPVAFLRWNAASWPGGVRSGGGHRLPMDLREAHERARRHAEAYRDALVGYEFDNEPDINFVEENPETYAAFLKACYLGVRAADTRPRVRWGATLRRFVSGERGVEVDPGSRPLAIMAPMALPPGPYFEQLQANGFLSYTDAFNYHFYGHAEDFSGVYRLFEDAVGAVGKTGAAADRDRLPVILTEYGYSGVSGPRRFGAEVRVEQWRWFKKAAEQIEELRIAGPMAFYLRPYFERKLIEFGLTVSPVEGEKGGVGAERNDSPASEWQAGGLTFVPGDFGSSVVERWMQRIGDNVGGGEATPALAWMLARGEEERRAPRDWLVERARPSTVVIDLVAGGGLSQLKRYNGYLLNPAAEAGREPEGVAEVSIYNFGADPVAGRLRWSGEAGAKLEGIDEAVLTVPTGGRVNVPVRLRCAGDRLAKAPLKIWFEPTSGDETNAVFATALYPATTGMQATVLERFDDAPERSEANRTWLLGRPRASDERALASVGRWLTSPHVRVEEPSRTRWRLVGGEFAQGPKEGRATVELPLRDDFSFPHDAVLRLAYRLAAPAGEAGKEGVYLEIYFRTANGNLFVVWPWALARTEWSHYLELHGNFTGMFQSRANLPWRFAENRPVSLVFSFYSPTLDGATIEIDRPEIVRIGR